MNSQPSPSGRFPQQGGPILAGRGRSTTLTLKLTVCELELLTTLACDQMFRRQFIDPKMPGHRAKPEELGLGKSIVERLQMLLKSAPTS